MRTFSLITGWHDNNFNFPLPPGCPKIRDVILIQAEASFCPGHIRSWFFYLPLYMCVNGPFLVWAETESMCRVQFTMQKASKQSFEQKAWSSGSSQQRNCVTPAPRVQMFHLLYSRCREFVYSLWEEQEVATKQTGILGQNIFRIMHLKLCCLDKALWDLACVVLRFFPSGLTTKYTNWENRNFKIFSKFHSFQFSSAILKNHGFNLLGWISLLLSICHRMYWSDQACS